MVAWLSLFAVFLLTLWLCAYGPLAPDRDEAPPKPAPPEPVPCDVPQTPSCAVEDRLTRRLLAGELTGERYRREMAALAMADAARKPFTVPPGT